MACTGAKKTGGKMGCYSPVWLRPSFSPGEAKPLDNKSMESDHIDST